MAIPQHIDSQREAALWIVVGLAGALLVMGVYRHLFPFAPASWSLTRGEAIDIALERIHDLSDPPSAPYVVANLTVDPQLELRVLEARGAAGGNGEDGGEDARRRAFVSSRLARQQATWTVLIYDPSSIPGRWDHRVEVSVAGDLVALQRRIAAAEPAGAVLLSSVATERARRFIEEVGLDLQWYEEPQERRIDQLEGQELALRFRDREALLGEDFGYGVEVRFTGDTLVGFSSWADDPPAGGVDPRLRRVQLLQTLWVFSAFLLLPPVAILFVRRYHEGLVGVRRGAQIFVAILACFAVVLLLSLRSSAEGSAFGNLSRQQMTWVWAALMVFIYYPVVALLGFFGWSLGESLCPPSWRQKLAAFDVTLRGLWTNATVASSALRGVALGLLKAGVILAIGLALTGVGARVPSAFLLGPWWENASWPGLTLLLVSLAYTLAEGLFVYLLLVPSLSQRLGRLPTILLVALLGGSIFFPPLTVLPVVWGTVLAVVALAIGVVVFLVFDLLTVLMATLVFTVTLGALPLVTALDSTLEVQGWLALLGSALPLVASLRFVGSGKRFTYQSDDVPPHVRRIAARERQRLELETARRIQSSILPDLPAVVAGIEVAHTYLPASEVGGDFYDLLALDDGRLSVAIGDVAGHGVSSGLVMSMARSALMVQVAFRPEVEEVFATLNRVVYQSARKRLLTTLCYALLDPRERRLVYASAGHLYPYRVARDGQVNALVSVAYPLGVRQHLEVHSREARLESGDTLFLSSDGLVEARRPGSDEPFGFERLEATLARLGGRRASELRDGVLAELARFAGEEQISPLSDQREDDLTVLVLGLP